MSVFPSDVYLYGCALMPESDGSNVGGAVDFTKAIAWYDLAVADTIDFVSDSASDTGVRVQVQGRDTGGSVQTPAAVTLNGVTPILGSQTFERLIAGVCGTVAGFPLASPGGVAPVGNVAAYRHTPTLASHSLRAPYSAVATGTVPALAYLATGDGASCSIGMIIRITGGTGAGQLRQIVAVAGYGTDVVAVNANWTTALDATSTYSVYAGMFFPIAPNKVVAVTRLFSTAAADAPTGSQRTFYEKVFVVNNNAVTGLQGAQIELVSEAPALSGGVLLDIALTTALNDFGTAANRQTAPATGVGAFVTQPALVAVPGIGNLPGGTAPNAAGAQGVWVRFTVPAGASAYKGSAPLRTQGVTT